MGQFESTNRICGRGVSQFPNSRLFGQVDSMQTGGLGQRELVNASAFFRSNHGRRFPSWKSADSIIAPLTDVEV